MTAGTGHDDILHPAAGNTNLEAQVQADDVGHHCRSVPTHPLEPRSSRRRVLDGRPDRPGGLYPNDYRKTPTMTSTVISTDGAILNLHRFEALRLYRGRLSDGSAELEEPIRESDFDELEDLSAETGFSVLALSGLGRSTEPVWTIVAEADTPTQILAVWRSLRSGRDWNGLDLGRVVELADEAPFDEEPF